MFPIKDRNPAWAEGQLFELRPDELRAQQQHDKAARRKAEEQAAKSYSDLYDLALARGYENPASWARNKIRMRKGFKPGGRGRWKKR